MGLYSIGVLAAWLAGLTIFAAPLSALAATVNLTADTTVVLPSDGSTYTLSSGGTFDNLSVSGGTMTFTMSAGESVTITSADRKNLSNDGGFAVTCGSNASSVVLSPSANETINVTPSGTCSSGGGSGTSYTYYASAPGTGSTTPQTATLTEASSTPPTVSAARLTAAQIQSVLALLAAFGADQSTIAKVSAALSGGSTSSTAPTAEFTRNLTLGSRGAAVRALQQYLDAHGTPVAQTGAGSAGQETDYFGPATRAALAKFQAAHGIKPAIGFFGPFTRAYVASHP